MAVTPNSIVTPQSFAVLAVTFINADLNTPKTIASGGANGSIVVGISATTNDTSPVDIQLFASDGGTDFLLGTARLNAGSGYSYNAPAISILGFNGGAMFPFVKLDGSSNSTLQLPPGWSLKVAPSLAVTFAKTAWVVGFSENL